MDTIFLVGVAAAVLTTAAFFPQVIKAHISRETKDLSLAMFLLLIVGLCFWIVYGIALQSQPVIAANSITLFLVLYVTYLKIKHG